MRLIKKLQPKHLFCVDPYLPYREGNLKSGRLIDSSPNEYLARKRLSQYPEQATLLKMDSVTAAQHLPDELDFVYLDGHHVYEVVNKELPLYYNKLKSGGVLGGHDINFYGVMYAVGEFCYMHKLIPTIQEIDWWIVKP
jgi:hypothetical protein